MCSLQSHSRRSAVSELTQAAGEEDTIEGKTAGGSALELATVRGLHPVWETGENMIDESHKVQILLANNREQFTEKRL